MRGLVLEVRVPGVRLRLSRVQGSRSCLEALGKRFSCTGALSILASDAEWRVSGAVAESRERLLANRFSERHLMEVGRNRDQKDLLDKGIPGRSPWSSLKRAYPQCGILVCLSSFGSLRQMPYLGNSPEATKSYTLPYT